MSRRTTGCAATSMVPAMRRQTRFKHRTTELPTLTPERKPDVIGLGIIACGDVAFRTYIPGILPHADRASVVATFDPIRERAERAAGLFPNAAAYTELEPFLAHQGLDGVFNL